MKSEYKLRINEEMAAGWTKIHNFPAKLSLNQTAATVPNNLVYSGGCAAVWTAAAGFPDGLSRGAGSQKHHQPPNLKFFIVAGQDIMETLKLGTRRPSRNNSCLIH